MWNCEEKQVKLFMVDQCSSKLVNLLEYDAVRVVEGAAFHHLGNLCILDEWSS